MAKTINTLPEGFVLDQPVSKPPPGFVLDQQGTELLSGAQGPERIERERFTQQLLQGEEQDRKLVSGARAFLNPTQPIAPGSLRLKTMDTFSLLEVVNQAKLFRDKRKRNLAFGELKRRGIPNEFIKTFTEIDDATGLLASLKGEAPEIIGGVIGAGAGALAGRGDPRVARRGAIIGAGVGAGVTELAREIFEREFRPERRRGALDLTKDTAFTAVTEALGEAGGRFVIEPLLGGLGRLGAKTTIPGAARISKELGEAGQQVAREGGASRLLGAELPIQTGGVSRALGQVGLTGKVSAELLSSQQSASRIIATLEGVTGEAFLGGGGLAKVREIAQPAAFPRFVSNKMSEITGGLDVLSLDEIGVIAQDAIHGSRRAGRNVRGASEAYNSLKRVMFSEVTNKIQPSNISSAQKIAQSILDEAAVGGTRLQLPPHTEAILQRVVNTGAIKESADLIFTRSTVNDLLRAAKLADEPKAGQVLAPVVKELTDIMFTDARKAGPGVVAELQRALKFTEEGKQLFSSKLIRKLVAEKMPPEKVLRVIFGAPGDETLSPLTAVRNVKDILIGTAGKNPGEIINDKFAWDQLRFGWLGSKLQTAADVDGVLGGTSFQKILSNFGDPAVETMFTATERAGIDDIVFASRLKARKPRKIATLIIKSAQVGGIAGGIATGKEGIALAALGGPAVLGQFLTSGLGKKLLTTGISKPTTAAISGLEGQFIAGMLRTKLEMQKKQKRLERFEAAQRRAQKIRQARPVTPTLQQQRGFGGRGF